MQEKEKGRKRKKTTQKNIKKKKKVRLGKFLIFCAFPVVISDSTLAGLKTCK